MESFVFCVKLNRDISEEEALKIFQESNFFCYDCVNRHRCEKLVSEERNP